jgi:hypothetical protein
MPSLKTSLLYKVVSGARDFLQPEQKFMQRQ